MKNRKFFLLIVGFLWGINDIYSQNMKDMEAYNSVAKEYIQKSIMDHPHFSEAFQLKDTNNISLIIPIYFLRDSFNDSLKRDYSVLSPYIDFTQTPYNQYVFAGKDENIIGLKIIKKINDRLKEIGTIPFGSNYRLGGRNPNLVEERISYKDKKVYYKQIKQYIEENPTTKVFIIFRLSGIWGYKDGKFIKILFKGNKYKEMDGDFFYKKYFYPMSKDGLKNLINGNQSTFIQTIIGA